MAGLVALVQLYVGLVAYGAGMAFQVRSGLGLDPWDVFHQGIARHLHVSLGLVVIAVGALVLLAWIPLRQRPGLGTVSNVVVLGSALDAVLAVLPAQHALLARIGFLLLGVVLVGAATGMYIGANFGPGPRDGLMTGLARRTGRSIRLTRTAIELTVLAIGWLLGGTVGIGTVVFALAIGPLAQLFLRIFARRPLPRANRGRLSRRSRRLLVVAVVARQPGRQPVDGHLEVRVLVDEGLQLTGQPGEADLLVAAPLAQLLDTAVGEVHGAQPSASVTTWCCSASCTLCEPTAGEAEARRETTRSARPRSSAGRCSAMNGHAPWFCGLFLHPDQLGVRVAVELGPDLVGRQRVELLDPHDRDVVASGPGGVEVVVDLAAAQQHAPHPLGLAAAAAVAEHRRERAGGEVVELADRLP